MKEFASIECFQCRKGYRLSGRSQACPKCGWSGFKTAEEAERWSRRDGSGYLKRARK